jgi:hypothetical protein
MKLRPLQGIDDLQFGDSIARAFSQLGRSDEERSHSDNRCRKTVVYRKKGLTLGFDDEDRLVFVAALKGEEEIDLWGDRPFESMRCFSDLRQWLERSGRLAKPIQDSFGARLEVRDEGITFCFSVDEPGELEGIQLYPA